MSTSIIKRAYTFVIPCYNEHPEVLWDVVRRLAGSLESMPAIEYEIIVVNDGSRKYTYSAPQQKNIIVVEHEQNRGYGASIITGISHAKYEWIGIVDADGTYPVEYFSTFISSTNTYDLIIGKRAWSDIPRLRRLPKYLLQKCAGFVADYEIPDLNSGMCLFRKNIFQEHRRLFPRRFSFTTTLTMTSLLNHYKVQFIAIPYYTRKGVSSIHPVKDTARFFSIILRLALYYKPLRFFIPLSLTVVTLAIARGVRDIFVADHIGGLSLILFFMAFQVFFFGLIAEIISKK